MKSSIYEINTDAEIDGESINIIPMIDVIFAILTFFIIATLDLKKIDTIDVNLPKAITSKIVDEKPFVLSIDKENNIFLGNKPISNKKDLVEQIKNILSDSAKNILVISADKDVSYGKIVEVLDQLRTINDLRIGISTEK